MKKFTLLFLASVLLLSCGVTSNKSRSSHKNQSSSQTTLRLLHWNIQNGMWDGQNDNYDRFVEFVKSNDPDVCVWCESVTLYITNTAESMPQQERYLPSGWEELAARYGHQYVYMGGKRDNYPQVITSKYPMSKNFMISHKNLKISCNLRRIMLQ